MKDGIEYGPMESWRLGRRWQEERLKIGEEYVSWPQHRELKEQRGRRCVFLGFEAVPYGRGTVAKVSYTDDNKIEIVLPEDLIAAWFLAS
jgi:hypothetical protein